MAFLMFSSTSHLAIHLAFVPRSLAGARAVTVTSLSSRRQVEVTRLRVPDASNGKPKEITNILLLLQSNYSRKDRDSRKSSYTNKGTEKN